MIKQIELAQKLLLQMGDARYYDVLKAEAQQIIEDLRAKYPHRPAMKDELNTLEAQLAKRKR